MLPWLRDKTTAALRKTRWLRSRPEEITKPQSEYQDDDDDDGETSTEFLHLRIVAPRLGVVLKLQISYFDTGLQVKEKALKKLESMHSPSRSSSSNTFNFDIHIHRLVRSSTKVAFRDFDSILNCHVLDGEEFLLLPKRANGSLNHLLNVQNCHGPTEKEILNRTKNFPLIRSSLSVDLNLSMDSAFFQGDLQHDLRKILSEIAKYSAFVIASSPFAEKLIKYYRQKILLSLNNHRDIVKLLMEMGFSHSNVLRALKLQGNNYSMALDWLVENVEKEEKQQDDGQSSLELSSESIEDVASNPADCTYRKFYSRTFPSTNSIFLSKHKAISIKDKVEGLLEIVRYYSEKNEEPATRADTVRHLINMGFVMEEIQQAFNKTNNNTTAACEWLIENTSNSQSSNTLREWIFVESHILKILLSTPQIQFSLSSPKFFIAYCSLLENYSSLNIFFNDLESQSLLQFILRTYQQEKIYLHTFDRQLTSLVVGAANTSSSNN